MSVILSSACTWLLAFVEKFVFTAEFLDVWKKLEQLVDNLTIKRRSLLLRPEMSNQNMLDALRSIGEAYEYCKKNFVNELNERKRNEVLKSKQFKDIMTNFETDFTDALDAYNIYQQGIITKVKQQVLNNLSTNHGELANLKIIENKKENNNQSENPLLVNVNNNSAQNCNSLEGITPVVVGISKISLSIV